jgi:hypothetical protein
VGADYDADSNLSAAALAIALEDLIPASVLNQPARNVFLKTAINPWRAFKAREHVPAKIRSLLQPTTGTAEEWTLTTDWGEFTKCAEAHWARTAAAVEGLAEELVNHEAQVTQCPDAS